MSGYSKPKSRLHREFLYLNDSTVVNALSAIESGKVDEIIEQAKTSKGAGVEVGLGYGPAKIAAKRGRDSDVTANLVRTRTAFSAFDAWYRHLRDQEAMGDLSAWDEDTRNELDVGDTVELRARVEFSPIHKVFAIFLSYADKANRPDSFFTVDNRQLPGLKKVAAQARGMLRGADGATSSLVYIHPLGVNSPIMLANLSDLHFVGDRANIDGEYSVIVQISSLLTTSDKLPALRAISDAPRTSAEVDRVAESVDGLVEAAAQMGVTIQEEDKSFTYPTVVVHPIAIYR